MAKAKRGDKVQVHYTGKLDDGTVFDSSGGSGYVVFAPVEFVLGQDVELLPKFQEAVVGLEAGQTVTVRILCEDAYGPRAEEKVHEIPRNEIKEKYDRLVEDWVYPNGKPLLPFSPRRGQRMELFLPDGNSIPATVTKVSDTTYTFDTNHPLAGQDLNYEITLVNIL